MSEPTATQLGLNHTAKFLFKTFTCYGKLRLGRQQEPFFTFQVDSTARTG